MPSGIKFYSLHPVREGAKRITIDVLQNGDSVNIRMHGLEDVNVCLASFLTKGVSYAQEKYNEYKQSPKSEAEVEISESIMASLKEVAHNEARKGCKPIKRESK